MSRADQDSPNLKSDCDRSVVTPWGIPPRGIRTCYGDPPNEPMRNQRQRPQHRLGILRLLYLSDQNQRLSLSEVTSKLNSIALPASTGSSSLPKIPDNAP